MNMQPTSTSLSQALTRDVAETEPFRVALPEMGTPIVSDYLTDALLRTDLFFDLLRRRGNEQEEMTSRPMATMLRFNQESLIGDRSQLKPINLSLSRSVRPEGTVIDPHTRPVVGVDPRAGQEPDIGDFKAQSEIGDALVLRMKS
jgi:hypothetical protein